MQRGLSAIAEHLVKSAL